MYCNPFAGASCWASHLNFFGILRHQDAHAYRPQKPLKKLMGGGLDRRNRFSSGGPDASHHQISHYWVTRIDSGTTEGGCTADRCTPQDPAENLTPSDIPSVVGFKSYGQTPSRLMRTLCLSFQFCY
jgi:hypothetical protein